MFSIVDSTASNLSYCFVLCFVSSLFPLLPFMTPLLNGSVNLIIPPPSLVMAYFVLSQTLFTPVRRHSLTCFQASSTQQGVTSGVKVWYSTSTSGSHCCHKFCLPSVQLFMSVGVRILNTATSSLCSRMHSSFPMTLASFTSFRSILLTRMSLTWVAHRPVCN